MGEREPIQNRLRREGESAFRQHYSLGMYKLCEEAADKIDGLKCDLESALDVLWRRGDDGARAWVVMNYPSIAKKFSGTSE